MALCLCLTATRATGQSPILVPEATVKLLYDAQVSAREAGVIVEIPVVEGQLIGAGDLIVQVDPARSLREQSIAELEYQIADVESRNDINLRFADKQTEVSAAEYARSLAAVRRFAKSVSQTELNELKLVAERSELAQEQAALELEVAKLTAKLRGDQRDLAGLRLADHAVLSPSRGMVVDLLPQVGEWVQPGTPIARVIRLDVLRVEAFIDDSYYSADLLGRQVTFHASNIDGSSWRGRVVFVSPEIEPVTAQIRIWADVENHDGRLLPGLRGELQLL